MSAAHSADPRPTVPFSSIPHLLEHQAKRIPEAPAILGPGRAPLNYGRLYRYIDQIGHTLRAFGIGRHDRIAVVLPNGPEMAVAALAVMASAVCAPLNLAHGSEELDRYFADLRPRALLTAAGFDSPARRAAFLWGIHVIELSTAEDPEAGLLTFTGEHRGTPVDDLVGPGDVALLFLTSGTTSQPKIVPLTHANICTSAYSWVTALALTETDRCLNVMPLFHGHGLIATVLASLAAGASVVCTTGCEVNSFFGWLTAFKPTWYSAVPTMHQAILAQARHHREPQEHLGLRFIRSGSAPLPISVFGELEQTFEIPVIEYYSMTEAAASPIASNPLPPRRRKPGSVGMPVGLDIAIMDENGALLPVGETGQVVIRGASVMRGYDGDRLAIEAAFAGDWFTTGDHGYFDDDGYLFLVGRSKEIINRGGEKIALREIDEVLLQHAAVAEAVTFTVPHATLGEDVAAAVVLRPGAIAAPNDVRLFVAGHLANFKVPRQVLIVGELPKGPTGKVQRIGLAAKWGLASDLAMPPTFIPPRTPLEKMLAGCWAEILRVERVGVHDDFFTLGGDSLLVTHVLIRVYDLMHVEIELSHFFETPTVAELARHLERLIEAGQTRQPSSAIVRAPRKDGIPASIAQERLCKLQRALPGIPFFNILYPLRVPSAVDAAVLERSLDEIVRRHEILRTSFTIVEGHCVQTIAQQVTVQLTLDDLRALPTSKRATVGHKIIQEEALHSFDLARGPLFRVRLVRLAKREHLLLLTMHQIIVDGWSLGVLVDELFTLYDAFFGKRPSPLASLPIQYADFAYWQRHWQSHPDFVAQLAYWREQLSDPLPVMQLGAAGSRDRIVGLRTARREIALPASLTQDTKRFANGEAGTLFMALVVGLKILLHRYLGQEDLRVATLVANRNCPGTERLIGPLVNTVILRTNLGSDPSPREVMRRVRATTMAAFAYQDLPFEELAETLKRDRALKPAALAPVMIVLQNATLRPTAGSDHTLGFEEANPGMLMPLVPATTFDIVLVLREVLEGLVGSCVYKPQLFDAKDIDCLWRDFQEVLGKMVTQPDQLISAIRSSE